MPTVLHGRPWTAVAIVEEAISVVKASVTATTGKVVFIAREYTRARRRGDPHGYLDGTRQRTIARPVRSPNAAPHTRPVHSILLGADIPILEHLSNLDQLPDSGFRFFA